MKLRQLLAALPGVQVRGLHNIEVLGIASHSQAVAPGYLFVARRGTKADGNAFVREAVAAGACAVLSDLYDPSLPITQVLHPQPHVAEALLAATYYGHPSEELFMVGITGTNGKTTTAYAIRHLFEANGIPTGLVSTVEYNVGGTYYPASRTTPDVVTNQRLLREMVHRGCKACVMEVTSHALDQGRVNHIAFDTAVFTNLTHDHLDYHKNMEQYAAAKAQLFASLREGVAVINGDDPAGALMAHHTTVPVQTYGLQPGHTWWASDLATSAQGTRFLLHHGDQQLPCQCPLAGNYNVANALAALAAARTYGIQLEQACAALATFRGAPGRLERVGSNAFVDYAHTDDALRNVLTALRSCTSGRLIVVFGCGGDRDREKRPKMGRVAEELADVVILTSDNPRSESPETICAAIAAGCQSAPRIVLDRRQAIAAALREARPDDIVLIAGKGHEATQAFAHHAIAFDDRLVVQELLI